jgi:hypothetical protein
MDVKEWHRKAAAAGGDPVKEPTLMQRRLFAELQKAKSVRQAAISAGFSPNTPTKTIMARLSETTLASELEKIGYNPQKIALKIADGMDAQKLHLAKDEEHWAPDWSARYKFLTLALRMFGIRATGSQTSSAVDDIAKKHTTVFQNCFVLMDQSVKAQKDVSFGVVENATRG